MRQNNSLYAILLAVRKYGPLYNHEIVSKTGLVKSTVTISSRKLIQMGLLEEEISDNPRKRVHLSNNYGVVIGIYMGLTSIHISTCDLDGNIILDFHKELDNIEPKFVTKLIIDTIESFNVKNLIGIGIGLPGPVNFKKKFLFTPPEMLGWDKYPICTILEELFSCPVIIDNDVNTLAIGEKHKGAARNFSTFMYIKVGTGIGAGLILNDNIYRGYNGAAGDIGHIAIDGSNEFCLCGNYGCLEVISAARGITKNALSNKNESPYLQQFKDDEINATIVGEGLKKGDPICTKIIIQSGKYIGMVLAKLVNFFNPELILIGGGISNSGQKFISSIQEIIYKRSTPLASSELTIKKAELGDEAGMIGAAILVLDHIFDNIL